MEENRVIKNTHSFQKMLSKDKKVRQQLLFLQPLFLKNLHTEKDTGQTTPQCPLHKFTVEIYCG